MPLPKLAGILLAAGQSQRFGESKQSAVYGGSTLIERAARELQRCGAAPVVGVLNQTSGDYAVELAKMGISVVINERPEEGLPSSLKLGIAEAEKSGTDAVLIFPCDQVLVTATHLSGLISLWRTHPELPAAAFYDGTVGVPAILPNNLFARVKTLSGDQGAGRILRGMDGVQKMEMPEAGMDIDTRDQLERLTNRSKK